MFVYIIMAKGHRNQKQSKRNRTQRNRNRRNRNRKQRGGMFSGALEALALPAGFFLAQKAVQKKKLPGSVKKTLKKASFSLKGGKKNNRRNRNTKKNRRNRNTRKNRNNRRN